MSRIKEDYTRTATPAARSPARHGAVGPRGYRGGDDHVLHLRGVHIHHRPDHQGDRLQLRGRRFLDAFVVRLTLIPAVMAIIGSRIWYHRSGSPGAFPDPDIEGPVAPRKTAHRELAAAGTFAGRDKSLMTSAAIRTSAELRARLSMPTSSRTPTASPGSLPGARLCRLLRRDRRGTGRHAIRAFFRETFALSLTSRRPSTGSWPTKPRRSSAARNGHLHRQVRFPGHPPEFDEISALRLVI